MLAFTFVVVVVSKIRRCKLQTKDAQKCTWREGERESSGLIWSTSTACPLTHSLGVSVMCCHGSSSSSISSERDTGYYACCVLFNLLLRWWLLVMRIIKMTFNTFVRGHVHSARLLLNCELLPVTKVTLTSLTPASESSFVHISTIILTLLLFPSSQSREDKCCCLLASCL